MRRASPLLALALLVAGCGGSQSTLRPNSDASSSIEHLWWVMFIGAAIVCAVVTMLVLVAVLRSRAERAPDGDDRRAQGLVLLGGFLVPLVVLVALFALIVSDMPISAQPRPGSADLTVHVVGHQWFWEARYPGGAVTANELHVPAGRPVEIALTTDDVIHSFWVPGLNRKIDAIPGRTNRLLLEAREPGVYRGQCAEFCGLQHANMGFLVFVDRPDAFSRWLARERGPARIRAGPGVEAFAAGACAGCHTIRGTPAQGKVGPDLTHVASRTTLASLAIPNNPAYLASWIADPQHLKPGNRMPRIALSGAQLQRIVAYLEELK